VKRQRSSDAMIPPSSTYLPRSPYVSASHSFPQPTLHFECFICGTALHDLDDSTKDLHLNLCLDKLEVPEVMNSSSASTSRNSNHEGIRSENYGCLLCGLSLSGKALIIRCQHLKRCSKIYGVGIRELLQMISPEKFEEVLSQMEDLDTDSATGVRVSQQVEAPKPNAHNILMANAKARWQQGVQPSAPSSSNSRSRNGRSFQRHNSHSSQDPKRKRDERDDNLRVDYAPEYKKVLVPPMTTPIIVDGFSFASTTLSDCYILTHFHSDHYSGLTRAFEYGKSAFNNLILSPIGVQAPSIAVR
jgi:hypothetical protein